MACFHAITLLTLRIDHVVCFTRDSARTQPDLVAGPAGKSPAPFFLKGFRMIL
ncbi:hypothetical protein MCBRY_004141 [Methylocystis bryophila]